MLFLTVGLSAIRTQPGWKPYHNVNLGALIVSSSQVLLTYDAI